MFIEIVRNREAVIWYEKGPIDDAYSSVNPLRRRINILCILQIFLSSSDVKYDDTGSWFDSNSANMVGNVTVGEFGQHGSSDTPAL